MPAILIQLFVCSWKGHIWKIMRMGYAKPIYICKRCAATKQDWPRGQSCCYSKLLKIT